MIELANLRSTLSERLAHWREVRGWTQHDLAAAAGMSASGLRGYEQRKRWPDPEELEEIAKALGIQVVDLLVHPSEAKPTKDKANKSALIGDIVAALPALNESQLSRILPIVLGIAMDNGNFKQGEVSDDLPHKQRKSK